jgi:Zn finger protein HypA/HybF involved in hydrogenase expression
MKRHFKCTHCGYDHGEIEINEFNTWDYLYGCPKCSLMTLNLEKEENDKTS